MYFKTEQLRYPKNVIKKLTVQLKYQLYIWLERGNVNLLPYMWVEKGFPFFVFVLKNTGSRIWKTCANATSRCDHNRRQFTKFWQTAAQVVMHKWSQSGDINLLYLLNKTKYFILQSFSCLWLLFVYTLKCTLLQSHLAKKKKTGFSSITNSVDSSLFFFITFLCDSSHLSQSTALRS